MSVFAIIGSKGPELLGEAIVTQYGASHYELASNVWLVSDSGSTRDVAERLGLPDGKLGASGVVLLISAYSGWSNGSLWTWLRRFPEVIPRG
jgi:hypothetical protein